jgi:hypothetical protein
MRNLAEGETTMKGITLLLLAVATLVGIVTFTAPPSIHADDSAAPAYVTKIPPGYRDWRLISVSLEEGNLNSLSGILGNDVAIKAYREAKLPYPDGTIIAALHYSRVPSAENNKVFGKPQSFVPGPVTSIQFMVKDTTKYAATGGWGFATFIDGKPSAAASMKSCFPCHNETKASDLVFTHYAP